MFEQALPVLTAAGSLGVLGLLLAGMLVIASKKFAVEEDPLIDEANELMPGANCGACGYAGCRQLAEQIVKTRDPDLRCPVMGAEALAQLAELLGMSMAAGESPVATLLCKGTHASAKNDSDYQGIQDCRAATLVYKGSKACSYGCLGLGSCIRACPFDAIYEKDGIVAIDPGKCTGCGKCVSACPKALLQLLPRREKVYVACNSRDRGPVARKLCQVSCIACTRCVRACEAKAITMVDNVAVIDQEKCTRCGKCVEQCPNGCILHPGATAKEDTPATPDKAATTSSEKEAAV